MQKLTNISSLSTLVANETIQFNDKVVTVKFITPPDTCIYMVEVDPSTGELLSPKLIACSTGIYEISIRPRSLVHIFADHDLSYQTKNGVKSFYQNDPGESFIKPHVPVKMTDAEKRIRALIEREKYDREIHIKQIMEARVKRDVAKAKAEAASAEVGTQAQETSSTQSTNSGEISTSVSTDNATEQQSQASSAQVTQSQVSQNE